MSKNKIHFEISERKTILYLFDVVFVLVALSLVGNTFNLEYLKSLVDSFHSVVLLVFYLSVFGTIFELYSLQVASNEYQVWASALWLHAHDFHFNPAVHAQTSDQGLTGFHAFASIGCGVGLR